MIIKGVYMFIITSVKTKRLVQGFAYGETRWTNKMEYAKKYDTVLEAYAEFPQLSKTSHAIVQYVEGNLIFNVVKPKFVVNRT